MRTTSIAHPEARRMKNNHTSVWIVVMLVLTICSTALSDDVSATKIHPHDPKPGEPPILVVQVWLMGVLVRDGVDLDDGLDGETELIITIDEFFFILSFIKSIIDSTENRLTLKSFSHSEPLYL